MNPYAKLQKIFSSRNKPAFGKIVSVIGTTAKVRIAGSIVDAQIVDATEYLKDNEVMIKDGIVQGKVKSESSVPTYFV